MKTEYIADDLDFMVDESVQEALLLAEFFRGVHQGRHCEMPQQKNPVTSEQLELAQEYLEQPLSINVFARSVQNKRRPQTS